MVAAAAAGGSSSCCCAPRRACPSVGSKCCGSVSAARGHRRRARGSPLSGCGQCAGAGSGAGSGALPPGGADPGGLSLAAATSESLPRCPVRGERGREPLPNAAGTANSGSESLKSGEISRVGAAPRAPTFCCLLPSSFPKGKVFSFLRS